MFKSILASLVVATITSHAHAATSIVCKYPTGEVSVFQGAGSIDITDPFRTGVPYGSSIVPLLVNGQGPLQFNLKLGSTRIGPEYRYSIQGKFHIEDIMISYNGPDNKNSSATEFVFGSHRTDYMEISLSCVVQR